MSETTTIRISRCAPRALAALTYLTNATLVHYGIRVHPATGAVLDPLPAGMATCFHSGSVPPFTVPDYGARIVDTARYGSLGVMSGLVLLGRYVHATGRLPTLLDIHRLLLICVTVAMKANSDYFLKNSAMARIGGVPLAELNFIELEFVTVLNFSCIVTATEMNSVCDLFLNWRQTDDPIETFAAFADCCEGPTPFLPLVVPLPTVRIRQEDPLPPSPAGLLASDAEAHRGECSTADVEVSPRPPSVASASGDDTFVASERDPPSCIL